MFYKVTNYNTSVHTVFLAVSFFIKGINSQHNIWKQTQAGWEVRLPILAIFFPFDFKLSESESENEWSFFRFPVLPSNRSERRSTIDTRNTSTASNAIKASVFELCLQIL